MPSRPFSANDTCMLCRSSTELNAKMLRKSSSTINTLRPVRPPSAARYSSSMRRCSSGKLAWERCRNSAVSSSKRSGERASFSTTVFATRFSFATSLRSRSFAVYTTIGTLRSLSSLLITSSSSKPSMSGNVRSRTMQSNCVDFNASSASMPVPTAMVLTPASPINLTMLSRSVTSSSTTSRLRLS